MQKPVHIHRLQRYYDVYSFYWREYNFIGYYDDFNCTVWLPSSAKFTRPFKRVSLHSKIDMYQKKKNPKLELL